MSAGDVEDVSLLALFRAEVESYAAILSEGLVALEANQGDRAAVEPLMRAAHSIKGAARVVGLDAAVRIAHAMEDALVAVQEGRSTVTPAGIDRLLRGVDWIVAMSRDIRAVFVTEDQEVAEAMRDRWERQIPDVPLVIVESPYRAVISPVIAYLDVLDQAWPPDKEAPITIVVLPEYVARHWWDRLLYNQTAKRLKSALLGREHTVVADVPYRRGQ